MALVPPCLGQGAYGSVHRGYVRGLAELGHLEGTPVAIKSPLPTVGKEPGVPQMQLREFVAMACIEPHPRIMPIHAGIIEDGERGTGLHFIMPCATGTAKDALKRMDAARALRWSAQLAEAVAHLHAQGWIHRDIKLENCMIFNDELVLGDLGLTRLSLQPATEGAASTDYAELTVDVCTETTRAPEVCEAAESRGAPTSRSYGISSDVWSVGACCLALAAQKYVFKRTDTLSANQVALKLLDVPGRSLADTALALQAACGFAEGTSKLPQAWWCAVADMLRVCPGARCTAQVAATTLRQLVSEAPKAEAPARPAAAPLRVQWQAFRGHSMIVMPRLLFGLKSSARSQTSLDLKFMCSCWDACRTLGLPLLVSVHAQLLLARALQKAALVPTRHLAAACVDLAAKLFMYSPPTLKSLASVMRVAESSVVRVEWQTLKRLGGVLICSDMRKVLELWPPTRSHGLGGNPLCISLVLALMAVDSGCDVHDAVIDAHSLMSGAAPGPLVQHSRIADLVRALRAGECVCFFRSWPGEWSDRTAAMRAWANAINLSHGK